jgi:hypothetical protein
LSEEKVVNNASLHLSTFPWLRPDKLFFTFLTFLGQKLIEVPFEDEKNRELCNRILSQKVIAPDKRMNKII